MIAKSLRHVGIVAGDIKKAIHFYRDILGLRIKKEALESGKYIDTVLGLKGVSVRTVKLVSDDGNVVELLFYKSRHGKNINRAICDRGYSHIAFSVSDIEYEYKRLSRKGVKFNSSPKISPNGRAKVMFCRDPEGNFIELVEQL